jgi:DNA topoisomerase-1
MVQLGDSDGDEKPRFATIIKPYNIDTLTLQQALKLLELPRELGEYEGKVIKVAVGRFGPYISHNSKFVSLKKTDDPMTISYERCIELIKEKIEKDKNNLIREFNENLRIVKDRWGHPTIWYKKKYYKLSSQTDPTTLSEADCMKIAGVDPEKEAAKKSTAKKSTTKKKTEK